jgi:hypothetical protein
MMTRTSAVGCSRKYGWITSVQTHAPATVSTAGSNAENDCGWMFTQVGGLRFPLRPGRGRHRPGLKGRSVKFGIGRTEDVRRRFRVVCLKGDAGCGQQASGYSCGMQTPRR